jgi:hypothetical protein
MGGAEEWPQFRGQGSAGISTGPQIRDEWSANTNLGWKAAGGVGKNKLDEMFWSSPALADEALFLRGIDNLYCIMTKPAEN